MFASICTRLIGVDVGRVPASIVDRLEGTRTQQVGTMLELLAPRPATYEAPRGRQGPPGLGPVMCSREVWAALRVGTIDAGGALLHEDRLHYLGGGGPSCRPHRCCQLSTHLPNAISGEKVHALKQTSSLG